MPFWPNVLIYIFKTFFTFSAIKIPYHKDFYRRNWIPYRNKLECYRRWITSTTVWCYFAWTLEPTRAEPIASLYSNGRLLALSINTRIGRKVTDREKHSTHICFIDVKRSSFQREWVSLRLSFMRSTPYQSLNFYLD